MQLWKKMIKFSLLVNFLTLPAFSIISCTVISSSLPDWYKNEEQFITFEMFMISKKYGHLRKKTKRNLKKYQSTYFKVIKGICIYCTLSKWNLKAKQQNLMFSNLFCFRMKNKIKNSFLNWWCSTTLLTGPRVSRSCKYAVKTETCDPLTCKCSTKLSI